MTGTTPGESTTSLDTPGGVPASPVEHTRSPHRHGWPRTWTTDWGGIVTLGAVGAFLLYILWHIVGWSDAEQKELASNLASLLFGSAACVLAWRAARITAFDQRTRQAWRLIALATLAFNAGDALWLYQESILGTQPFPSWADAAYLMFYPLMLCGLLAFPVASRTRGEVVKFWLDAGTVLLAGGMVIWYLAMPASLSEQPDALAVVLSLAYPMGDMVLLFGIATILLSRLTRGGRPVLWLLAAGLSSFFIADLAFAYLTLHGGYMSGHWIDLLWIGASISTLLSAYTHHQMATRLAAAAPEPLPDARPTRWLPYVAVGIGYCLLLGARSDQWGEPLGILIIGAVALTILVIARQVTVLRDNTRLLAQSAAIARDNERLYQEAQAALMAMRASQAQLVQAGKLAAVGTLAAGVAHELNQPLMVIRGQTQLLMAHDDSRRADRLARIERQTEKMEAIINHLRDFGRMSLDEPGRPVDLNTVVGEALLLVGAQLRERGIDLRLELAQAPPVALADAHQIEQIVLNLLGNARDALGQQGEIIVRSWADDHGCYLCITDSGPGLSDAVLSRIFEPFFTTKHVGQGTGLGLSISRDIARRWDGDLTLTNRGDGCSGAVATLVVPRAPDASLHRSGPEPIQAGTASGLLLAPPPWKDAQTISREA